MTELYGTSSCRYTAELRENLEWRDEVFVEYDVECDSKALARMLALTGGNRTVPVLVRNGRVAQVGVNGHGCFVNVP